MMWYIFDRITLILGSVLLLFYAALIPYLLIYSISPNYMKLAEPQTGHWLRRAGIPENARGPPKKKRKNLNLRRYENSDNGIFLEKMAEMFYKYCTRKTENVKHVKHWCKTWACKTLIKNIHAYMRANIKNINMITTKIIFDRRKVADRKNQGAVEIRITENRKSYWIATGIRVFSHEWAAGQVVNRQDAPEMNKRLALIFQRVSAEVNRFMESCQSVNIEELRRNVWAVVESEGNDFLEWIEEQIASLQVVYGTRKHYTTLLTRLKEWQKIQTWQDVTVENLYGFDAWLHGRGISNSGVYNYHKCLKALLHRAVEFGRIDANPYARMRVKRGEKENVEYLTEDEMRKFEAMVLPTGSQLDIAHDLFIFQMYTGLPYSDMQAFDMSEYKWDGGKWNNVGTRIKTGVPYVSSILPPALHVLEKYNLEIPKMNNSDYNKQLKALQTMAGIKTRLHSHLARHTFATFMLRNGVKIENVSKMLGHTNITQTQRYAKVLAQSVHDEWDMIAEKLGAVAQHQTKQQKRKKSNSIK